MVEKRTAWAAHPRLLAMAVLREIGRVSQRPYGARGGGGKGTRDFRPPAADFVPGYFRCSPPGNWALSGVARGWPLPQVRMGIVNAA